MQTELTQAIDLLEAKRDKLTAIIDELRTLDGPSAPPKSAPPVKKKRVISAEGRKAIAAGQRRRWLADRKKRGIV